MAMDQVLHLADLVMTISMGLIKSSIFRLVIPTIDMYSLVLLR